MSKYILKEQSRSSFLIFCAREQIGFIRAAPNGAVGKINGHTGSGKTVAECFHNLVAIANRIALCGENDEAKARTELARRNAETARRVAAFNTDPAVQEITKAINDVSRTLGIRAPFSVGKSLRSRKIRL